MLQFSLNNSINNYWLAQLLFHSKFFFQGFNKKMVVLSLKIDIEHGVSFFVDARLYISLEQGR